MDAQHFCISVYKYITVNELMYLVIFILVILFPLSLMKLTDILSCSFTFHCFDSHYFLQVPSKLPFLYLIDSIMKNVGEPYVTQFGENLVSVFTKSFEEVFLFFHA